MKPTRVGKETLVKFSLADGTWAHLQAIVQDGDYRRDYPEPREAVDEIKRLARLHLPSSWIRSAPLLLIGAESQSLNELMRQRKLPTIMCVGQFVSYRNRPGKTSIGPVFLNVVWLQEDWQPYFSRENEVAFKQVKWDSQTE